ncbi:MAG: LuxR C-terminal-related transcriptional regulator [Kofleriaceae bacterium]
MIRVAIAEEHSLVRWALREALSRVSDLRIVADAGTVADLLAIIERERPDVLLLDASLPDREGRDALTEISKLEDGPLVVVLGGSHALQLESIFAARTIAAGAHGYVPRSATPDELLDAIRAVNRGERMVPREVEKMAATGLDHPAGILTRRELQVMELLARGMTNAEIAEHLGISTKTVDTHRGHVMKKLQLRNNSDLTRFAVKHGYVAL